MDALKSFCIIICLTLSGLRAPALTQNTKNQLMESLSYREMIHEQVENEAYSRTLRLCRTFLPPNERIYQHGIIYEVSDAYQVAFNQDYRNSEIEWMKALGRGIGASYEAFSWEDIKRVHSLFLDELLQSDGYQRAVEKCKADRRLSADYDMAADLAQYLKVYEDMGAIGQNASLFFGIWGWRMLSRGAAYGLVRFGFTETVAQLGVRMIGAAVITGITGYKMYEYVEKSDEIDSENAKTANGMKDSAAHADPFLFTDSDIGSEWGARINSYQNILSAISQFSKEYKNNPDSNSTKQDYNVAMALLDRRLGDLPLIQDQLQKMAATRQKSKTDESIQKILTNMMTIFNLRMDELNRTSASLNSKKKNQALSQQEQIIDLKIKSIYRIQELQKPSRILTEKDQHELDDLFQVDQVFYQLSVGQKLNADQQSRLQSILVPRPPKDS